MWLYHTDIFIGQSKTKRRKKSLPPALSRVVSATTRIALLALSLAEDLEARIFHHKAQHRVHEVPQVCQALFSFELGSAWQIHLKMVRADQVLHSWWGPPSSKSVDDIFNWQQLVELLGGQVARVGGTLVEAGPAAEDAEHPVNPYGSLVGRPSANFAVQTGEKAEKTAVP